MCIKFNPKTEGTLWTVTGFDGGKVGFKSERGEQVINEIRGERVEIHTLLDESLMIKVRRPLRNIETMQKMLSKSSLILSP